MKVIILRGISGCGKSTFTNKLLDACKGPAHAFSTDDEWETEKGYKFDVTRLQDAHAGCLRRFMLKLSWGLCPPSNMPKPELLIVDNTNTRAAEAAPYYATAKANTVVTNVKVVTIVCNPVMAWEYNRHHTPAKVIWEQHRRLIIEELPSWWDQEVCWRVSGELDLFEGFSLDAKELLEKMA